MDSAPDRDSETPSDLLSANEGKIHVPSPVGAHSSPHEYKSTTLLLLYKLTFLL